MTAFALGLLGLVLSLVVPGPLARATWPLRTPTASVLLWQAVVLASVLSAVGVVLIAPEELAGALRPGPGVRAAGLVGALAVALLIVVRLVVSLVGVMRRSAARRERHRELVDLLDVAGAPDEQVRVLAAAVPLAYGLPGRAPRVVLTDGALRVLGPDQLRAVLAHEQAHLDARHDVVLESFTAFHRAVPRPLRNGRALEAVELLLEAAADDAARRTCGETPVRGALQVLGDAVGPPGGGPPDDASTTSAGQQRLARSARLGLPVGSRARSAAVVVLAGAVLVLPTVVLVVPWLTGALDASPLR